MRRQKAHCTRKPHSSGQHSAVGDSIPTDASSDDVCGYWMKVAKDTCGRKPLHPGKHITAKALKQQVANRPRKTTRRRGVRLSDDPEVRHRWYRSYKFKRLGITEEEFNRRLEEQGYACAFCGDPFEDGQRIVADHDHNCCPLQPDSIAKTCGKCIRGLLHWGCNTRVGYVEMYRAQVDTYLAWAAARAS
jgi:hypothetical protein